MQFVTFYYQTLSEAPANLKDLYNNNSTFSFSDDLAALSAPQFHGTEAITGEILNIAREDLSVRVAAVDAQPTIADAVFVTTSGTLHSASRGWRYFTQTFVLEKNPRGYNVRNEVLRILEVAPTEEEEETEVEEEEEEPEEPVALEKEQSPQPGDWSVEAAVQEKHEEAAPEVAHLPPAADPEPIQPTHTEEPEDLEPAQQDWPETQKEVESFPVEERTQQLSTIPATHAESSEAETAPSHASPSAAAKSYAELASIRRESGRTGVRPPSYPAAPRGAPRQQGSEPPADREHHAAPAASSGRGSGGGGFNANARSASPNAPSSTNAVYVGQLPESATENDIKALFAQYGTIDNVVLKREKGNYCFVNFRDSAGPLAVSAVVRSDPTKFKLGTFQLRVDLHKGFPAGGAGWVPRAPKGGDAAARDGGGRTGARGGGLNFGRGRNAGRGRTAPPPAQASPTPDPKPHPPKKVADGEWQTTTSTRSSQGGRGRGRRGGRTNE